MIKSPWFFIVMVAWFVGLIATRAYRVGHPKALWLIHGSATLMAIAMIAVIYPGSLIGELWWPLLQFVIGVNIAAGVGARIWARIGWW